MDTQSTSRIRPTLLGALVLLVGLATAASVALLGPAEGDSDGGSGDQSTPAFVERIGGSDMARVTLSQRAAERLDVQTTETRATGGKLIVPYGALLYDAHGATWIYTSPDQLVYQRTPVTVEKIRGDDVFLTQGPTVGTLVVTVGATELYGAEFGVGH